jgi:hypothetical protein
MNETEKENFFFDIIRQIFMNKKRNIIQFITVNQILILNWIQI